MQLSLTDAIDDNDIDINEMVLKCRRQRMGLVQTAEQLQYAWRAVISVIEDEGHDDRWVHYNMHCVYKHL
jgi:protein tyrosine phosphatase